MTIPLRSRRPLRPPYRAAGISRRGLARGVALATAVAALPGPGTAHAGDAYNCVNVVLRDPYWGQFRRTIQTASNAAGIAPALERAGFRVTEGPSVGAIMWWPPNYYGASAAGHVGLVDAVHADGSVRVRHENWPYGSPERLQTFPSRAGYRYIHRPDASGANGEASADAGAAD